MPSPHPAPPKVMKIVNPIVLKLLAEKRAEQAQKSEK